MMKKKQITLIVISLFILVLAQTTAFALPSDNQAKMYIVSDTAEINRLTGIGIYTGHVAITRGTTHITSDKLTTYNDKSDQIKKAIAVGHQGKRAEYRTLTSKDKPILIAKAITITYFPQKHYVILTGDAAVSQGKDYITGPHLEYDLAKQILITKKSKQTKKSQRTTIVIQPSDFSSSDNTSNKE